jgi:deoxyribose-phosphate aldolase
MLVRSPQVALQRLFDEVGSVDQIGIDERVARRVAEQREHRGRLGGVVAGVAASEGVGRSEKSGGRRHV